MNSLSSVARPTTSGDSSGGTRESHFVIANCRRNTDVAPNLNPNANQETSEESDNEERVLAVYCRSGKLGAAYYTLQTGELFIMDEIVDRPPEFLMFRNLHRQVEPVRMLLDGKTQGAFVSTVNQTVFGLKSLMSLTLDHRLFILDEIVDRPPEFLMFRNLHRQVEPVRMLLDGKTQGAFVSTVKQTVFAEDGEEGHCSLVFVSAKEYSFEACKRRIYSLALPHEPPNCTEEERTMFLRTVVDFSQTQSVHALGALLRYLDLNWSSLNMDMQSKPQFLSLRKVSLADIVTIDEDTYRGLQIFSPVSHPSNFKKGMQGSNKEGLSLCHLYTKCSSKVGQSRMRVLLQHPTTDLTTLKQRQDVVAFFLKPQNEPLMRNMCASLRFIKNVNGILTKIKALSAKAYQWKSLYNTLYNAVLICEMCENVGRQSEFLQQLATTDNQKLYEMALYMNRIIDFDLSKTEGKFTVKAGVDPELDIKKQTMASLHGLMSETAKVELDRLPTFIEECSMLYMPHLGYLLAVKAWSDSLTPSQKELPDMKFMFQNNEFIHYKSKGCEELDVMIGDTYPEIVAHETRIMMRLTSLVLGHLHTLAAVVDSCALLDCLITFSKIAKELNFTRPTLTTDKVISITQGRHPLHQLTCENFVPNDTQSSEEAGFVKILTGPNSSGKSVYIKQVGLIVYLAHIGSFVPADSATIGVVDHIYTRIQSAECVAGHMSAFLIDLRQMALALQESTSNSLLIIDEFGKGTSAEDGLALLAACLNTLLFQGPSCPHVLLATHMLDVSQYIAKSPVVRFMRFEHMIQDGSPVFLFRLIEGRVDSSFAHSVAAASGIDERIIKRAGDVMACLKKNTLPPANKKFLSKLQSCVEIIKNELLTEDI